MKKIAKKASAKSAPKKERGNLTKAEITPLVMAARTAYDFQKDLGNVESGEDFNKWRHNQCMEAVGKPGITACFHDHYRPLMAHFQILAGKDEKAFQNLTTTGQASKQDGDTHEARRKLANFILETLTDHVELADMPWQEYLAKWEAASAAKWAIYCAEEPFPGLNPDLVNKAAHRKQSIAGNDGPIRQGYLVYIVRSKTRRPDLRLGRDLAAGLAERCTVGKLTEIRDTLINRIAAKEGTGETRKRNRKQSSPGAQASRFHKNLDPRQ